MCSAAVLQLLPFVVDLDVTLYRFGVGAVQPVRLRLRGEVHVVHVRARHRLLLADAGHRSPTLLDDQVPADELVGQPVPGLDRRNLRLEG